MKSFEITFKGTQGNESIVYKVDSRKEALQQALEDGAIVIKEITEGVAV